MIRIQVLKGPSGKWYWRIKARNGRTLASSETYSSRQAAHKTAEDVWYCFVDDYTNAKLEVLEK